MNLLNLAKALYELNFKKISSKVYELSNVYQNPQDFEDRYSEDIEEELNLQPENEYLNNTKYLEKNLSNKGNAATNKNNPLRNNMNPQIIYDILEDNDFHAIGTGSNPSGVVGHGAYGYVVGGTYKGMDCVAKVVVREELFGEANNWLKILSLNIPKKLKKHIPKIYAIRRRSISAKEDVNSKESNNTNEAFNSKIKYEIIIMERLYPFKESGVMRGYLLSSYNYEECLNYFMETINLLKNPNLTKYLAKEILSELLESKNRSYSGKKMTEEYLQLFISSNDNYRNIIKLYEQTLLGLNDLNDGINSYEKLNIMTTDLLRKKYENKFLSYTNKISVAIFDLLYDEYNLDDVKDLSMINKLIKNAIESQFQNEQPMQSDSKWYAEPQTKTFIELLNYLRDNGIIYSDLHDQNIMVSKDNTLKFIDVGLWKMPEV